MIEGFIVVCVEQVLELIILVTIWCQRISVLFFSILWPVKTGSIN